MKTIKKNIFSGFYTYNIPISVQPLVASPVNPDLQMQMASWLFTWQTALGSLSHFPGQTSWHLLVPLLQYRCSEQSLFSLHSQTATLFLGVHMPLSLHGSSEHGSAGKNIRGHYFDECFTTYLWRVSNRVTIQFFLPC